MALLRYLDPAIRFLVALLLTIVAGELSFGGHLDLWAVLIIWGPFVGFALMICLLAPRSVERHIGFYAILFVAVALAVGAATLGGGAGLLFLTPATVPASVLFALSYRWRAPPEGRSARSFLPATHFLLIAGVALVLGLITPPLIEILASTTDQVRKRALVDAVAATWDVKQPRGDRFGLSNIAELKWQMTANDRQASAYLSCGGPILHSKGGGVPAEFMLADQLANVLQIARNDEERHTFRTQTAEINSALRLETVQLCIASGLCRRPWYDYLNQPDMSAWRSAFISKPYRSLPGDYRFNEQIAEDYACGVGKRLSKVPATSLHHF